MHAADYSANIMTLVVKSRYVVCCFATTHRIVACPTQFSASKGPGVLGAVQQKSRQLGTHGQSSLLWHSKQEFVARRVSVQIAAGSI